MTDAETRAFAKGFFDCIETGDVEIVLLAAGTRLDFEDHRIHRLASGLTPGSPR